MLLMLLTNMEIFTIINLNIMIIEESKNNASKCNRRINII